MSTIKVKTKRENPKALFLREFIANGTTTKGSEVEFSQSGYNYLLFVTLPDGTQIKQSLQIGDLVEGWANKIEEEALA